MATPSVSGPQTYPDPPPAPEKPFSLLPTGPRQRSGTKTARSIHPGPDTHVRGSYLLTCISDAFSVCRPLTTGAIFVSQRCSLKPFKNGKGAGKKTGGGWGRRESNKSPSPLGEGLSRHIRKFGGLLAPDPPGEFARAEGRTSSLSEFLYNSRKTFPSYKASTAG